ncbi:MAG: hypothetical protein IKY52_15155 [Clostridia bacterium]|nr:hypothetical protein [Clostridia bacterium]
MTNPFQWAKKVPRDWIARLYAADAAVPDEVLADQVGWALAARCDSIIAVTAAYETGKLPCPRCGETILLTEESFVCTCGFAAALDQFRASYRGKQLYGANALPVFVRFRREFPRAADYRAKMAAIDELIHSFHLLHSYRLAESEEEQEVWTPETDPDVPLGRSTAVNLIEGSLTEVVRFLDTLSAAETAPAGWREALHRSNGFSAEKR